MDYHNTHECLPGYFQCDDGECVSSAYVCDKFEDCIDGSDEINCQDDSYDYDYNKHSENEVSIIWLILFIANHYFSKIFILRDIIF